MLSRAARRVADAARGAGAAAPHRAGAGGRADLVRRTRPRSPSTPAGTRSPTGWASGCGAGSTCSAPAAWPRCTRRSRRRPARPGAVAARRRTADDRPRPPRAAAPRDRRRQRLGLPALLEWFRSERREAFTSTERTRRLDTDAAAVQILTIHGSKGLQYPVVYLPHFFDCFVPEPTELLYHDEAGARRLDLAGSPEAKRRAARAEDAGEELRLTYVALTRAQSQVVTWWAPTPERRPLRPQPVAVRPGGGRGRGPGGSRVPTDDEACAALRGWQDGGRASRSRRPTPGPAPAPAARGRAGAARRPPVRPRARHRVAAHVVLRPDPRRGAAGQRRGRGRAGGAGHRRRGRRAVVEELATPGRRSTTTWLAVVCSPRWPTCPPARRSGRWCTRCSSTPTRGARPARRAAPARRGAAALVAGRRRSRRAGRGAGADAAHPARAARRRPDPGRHPARRPAARARLRVPAGRRRPRPRPPDVQLRDRRRRAAPSPRRRRPDAGLRRPAGVPVPGRASCCAAT